MPDFKFRLSSKVRKYANLQVNGGPGDVIYTGLSKAEYDLFGPSLEKKRNIKTVLELGCGLGRMSIYVHNQLNNPAIKYFLADSTGRGEGLRYGWNQGDDFYNDLKLTEEFAIEHGLRRFQTFDLSTRSLAELTNIDVIMSFLSVGFHIPLSHYWSQIEQARAPDALMIFGVRRNHYHSHDFPDYEVEIKANHYELRGGLRTLEDILILNPKKEGDTRHSP